MKITKDIIIEALENEPLATGKWIHKNKCAFCAVGATLRRAGMPTQDATRFTDVAKTLTAYNYSIFDTAPEGNYLSALSIVWEFLNVNNEGTAEDFRLDILRWAHDNVPDDYEITLDDVRMI